MSKSPTGLTGSFSSRVPQVCLQWASIPGMCLFVKTPGLPLIHDCDDLVARAVPVERVENVDVLQVDEDFFLQRGVPLEELDEPASPEVINRLREYLAA